jgi:hypothetical protein
MANTKKILIWVGAGCGSLLLLSVIGCVGCVYFGQKWANNKMADEVSKKNPELAAAIRKGGVTGGIQGAGGQMIASGVAMYAGSLLVTTLPKEEQKECNLVLEKLVKTGPKLNPEDIKTLSEAMDHARDKSLPTQDEARTFFADLKSVTDKY